MVRVEQTEGNVKYIIDPKGDDIYLNVINLITNKEINYKYECIRQPIFGYDWEDVQDVNKKLDEMINSVK